MLRDIFSAYLISVDRAVLDKPESDYRGRIDRCQNTNTWDVNYWEKKINKEGS